MKILHLCLGNFFIDGYSYQENLLPKYHVKMGHDVLVIASLFTFDSQGRGSWIGGPCEYDDPAGFHVKRLAFRRPSCVFRTLRKYKGFYDSIAKFSPDIIFSHNVSFADTTVVAKYLKNHSEVRLFADNHGDFVNSARNWISYHIKHKILWRYYAKQLEPYLQKCYGVTPMRCRFLKEMYHISPDKVEFLPMGVDDDAIPTNRKDVRNRIRKELHIGNNDFVIFTGGKIDRLKNTHILISALEQINIPDVRLIICGTLTPEMEYLNAKIGSNKFIHYLGWCDASRVMECMIASDIACFPGTHSTLWEQAVGVGLPLIVKQWDEMEHVNVNGNCLFVCGDNPDELVKDIREFCSGDNFLEFKEKADLASKSFLYSQIAKKSIGK